MDILLYIAGYRTRYNPRNTIALIGRPKDLLEGIKVDTTINAKVSKVSIRKTSDSESDTRSSEIIRSNSLTSPNRTGLILRYSSRFPDIASRVY
jgi:hypothetical protein